MKKPSDIPIQFIKGVGPAKAKLLENLGIFTVEDLLYFFPRRYEDRSKLIPISQIKIGEWQTISGEVIARGGRQSWFTKKYIFETAVGDESGRIFCVWFNQPYLDKYLTAGKRVVLYGKVDMYKNKIQMISPEYEVIDEEDESLNMNRIVPVYPLTKGITQRYLRKLIRSCLDEHAASLEDVIPASIRGRQKLKHIAQNIRNMHFPENSDEQELANQRASFEEFFLFQISIVLRRMSIVQKKGIAHSIEGAFILRFCASFPFPLTRAQQKSVDEIAADMKKPTPMLRLLQGDVGSGKTLVSFFGCVAAVANGHQAAVMAPTEILAQQHFQNFNRLVVQAGFKNIRAALLISSVAKRDKDKILADLKAGLIDVLIGTHALVQETVEFKNLSYVVVDEQHKFGVKQRALLSAKGTSPDVLVMTATPIPRTLCLTLFGDLDVSVINEMPAGRGTVQTHLVPMEKAATVYERVREWVKKGTQAYIVYPIIEESEKLDLKAATEMYEHFLKHEFKDLRLGLLYGAMDRQETQQIMELFKSHKLDILVATTVLEVGIDVPNANVMVIEHAERFGLSQLHQLRGRIGRSQKNAICLLIADPKTQDSQARLDAIVKTTDGFKIAQEDLNIRGPGHYFGRFQHGANELRVANPLTQLHVLEAARQEAIQLLGEDAKLQRSEHRMIKDVIRKRYPEYLSMVFAG
jgi:ATP-dependent DNA helicase RecG